jgi:hypothetical protein
MWAVDVALNCRRSRFGDDVGARQPGIEDVSWDILQRPCGCKEELPGTCGCLGYLLCTQSRVRPLRQYNYLH